MMPARDEFGQFIPQERKPMKQQDPFVMVAMLVAVELIVIGACAIYSLTGAQGHDMAWRLDEAEVAGRAIFGGVMFASGATLGILGFMR
jgi:hypothetical protein